MSELIGNPNGIDFFENIAQTIEQARRLVGRTADLTMCMTYFEVGRMIVEEEQNGKARAEYGKGLLAELSRFLTVRFKQGFSSSTLKNARKFYQVYAPSIRQAMLAEFENSEKKLNFQSFLTVLENSVTSRKGQAMLAKSYPFTLSWSHYLILMRIKNDDERKFYEIEAMRQHWPYRFLQRQYGSSLYRKSPRIVIGVSPGIPEI